MSWQDIDTAPRDSIILASGLDWGDGPKRHLVFARWQDYHWVDANDEDLKLAYLTHWFDVRSLPEPASATPTRRAETTGSVGVADGGAAPEGGDAHD